ncbi:hypothetical protein GZH46_00236, partial [Fragariocoptes setiger]
MQRLRRSSRDVRTSIEQHHSYTVNQNHDDDERAIKSELEWPNRQSSSKPFSLTHFDASLQTNVTVQLGQSAYLTCKLGGVHDNLVSWVRNLQILTSGEFRYTSDERYKPKHVEGTHDWILEIENVNVDDAGLYECQINTEPNAVSVPFQLNVIATSIVIVDGATKVVPSSSDIHLMCVVNLNGSPHPSSQSQQTRQGVNSNAESMGASVGHKQTFDDNSIEQGFARKSTNNEHHVTPAHSNSYNNNNNNDDGDDDDDHDTVYRLALNKSPAYLVTNDGKSKTHPMKRQAAYTLAAGHATSNASRRRASLLMFPPPSSLSSSSSLSSTNGKTTVQYVYWYKDGKSLNYDQQRGGVKIYTSENETHLISKLTIEDARLTDSGLYKCNLLPPLEGVPAAELRLTVNGSPSAGLFRSSATLSVQCPMLLSIVLHISCTFLIHAKFYNCS